MLAFNFLRQIRFLYTSPGTDYGINAKMGPYFSGSSETVAILASGRIRKEFLYWMTQDPGKPAQTFVPLRPGES